MLQQQHHPAAAAAVSGGDQAELLDRLDCGVKILSGEYDCKIARMLPAAECDQAMFLGKGNQRKASL